MTKSNWKKCKLGDALNFHRGYDLPKEQMTGQGYPVVGSNGIIGYHKEYTTSNPCLVIGRSGNTGKPAIYHQHCWAHNTTLYVDDFKNNNAQFLFYMLKTMDLGSYAAGSAVPTLNRNHIHPLEISLPPLEEQKRIAEILGAFDDKIELLQKQNKTLEEMAKAIFKSWFVYFDIVRAKQKGEKKEDIIKNYHLTEELYNLFPSSFVDSSLGPIPLGWEVDKLINRCTIMLGGTPSRLKKEYWKHGTIPWIASGKVNDFRIATPSEYITQEGLNNSATKLMPKRTTVIAITGATLGQISLTEIKCCANQSVVSVLGDKDLFSEYIYFWIQHNINLLLSKQTGGAQQHINKNDVESLLVLVPSNNILKPYLHQVKPLFDKISNNIQQIQTLTELRDTLLPRLISGKIKV